MSLNSILKLGDPRLYKISSPVLKEELGTIQASIEVMHNALEDFRTKYGSGRAVAAPQIAVLKRFIYLNNDDPVVIINPELYNFSDEKVEIWDDCLCFPGLYIKVKRAKSVKLRFRDINWDQQEWELEGDLSELIQHEYDHLDGILATQRAIDEHSFKMINAE